MGKDLNCKEIKAIFKNLRAWRNLYQDFMGYEKNCMAEMRKQGYTRKDMFIIYCRAYVGWSRETVSKFSKGSISEYSYTKTLRKLNKPFGHIPRIKSKSQI